MADEARVTQQYAEVGGAATDRTARVTQQYVEVGVAITPQPARVTQQYVEVGYIGDLAAEGSKPFIFIF